MEKRLEKRKVFEDKQLEKLSKEQKKGQPAYYFIITLIIIVLVDLLDNFTTSSTENITSAIINDFFVNQGLFGRTYTYEEGLAIHNSFSILGRLLGIFSPFFKSLGDKYGRKPLLAMSTCGMALGMLLVYTSRSYIIYLLGTVIMTFFFGADIQIIYVLEEAPAKNRALVYSVLKSLGALGVAFIPLLRSLVMKNDPKLWREIFKYPGLIGVGVAILVLLFVKETRVFVTEKVKYLSMPFKERLALEEEQKAAKRATSQKSGIFNALRYIIQHKDIRTLILTKTVFDVCLVAMTYYESIMFKAGMSTADITTAEYFYPFIYAASLPISGFIADKLGRKRTIQLFGVICLVCYISFMFSTGNLLSPVLVGVFYGLYLGSYWIGRDYMQIMMTEMVPTDIRASVLAGSTIYMLAGILLGYAYMAISGLLLPLPTACILLSVPLISVSLFMLTFKVRETKGTEYETIEG